MIEYKVYYISQEGLLKEPKCQFGYPIFERFISQEEALDEIEKACKENPHEYNNLQFVILPVPRI